MGQVHREIVRRLAADRTAVRQTIRAAIIDTPYGFQPNADALSADQLDYFGRRLGMTASIASFRRSDDDVLAREAAFAHIRSADFVFSGPGSPTYALRQWSGTLVPRLMVDKLRNGGALVAASAAALTLGRLTVPVYEIYKSGADPSWADGLDVLSTIGLNVAVIPHWDNAEGGGHDTRYCWLGERRLRSLEEQMPPDTFILGVDEHTALLVDLNADRASVRGRGRVTARYRGKELTFAAGEEVTLDQLRQVADAPAPGAGLAAAPALVAPEAPLVEQLLAAQRDASTADARAALVEPLVEVLLGIRATARASGDYATADAIRDRLLGLGLELRDSAGSPTTFRLPPTDRS